MPLTDDRILTLLQSREIKQSSSSFHLSLLSQEFRHGSMPLWVQQSQRTQQVQFISAKIRERDLTSAPWLRLNHALFLSVFYSVTHLVSPSSSSSSTSVHLLPFASPSFPSLLPGVRPQHKFIGGGGMPVEVKRVSGSPSASPIILYG